MSPSDYERMRRAGIFEESGDPFGDFDLLFGAARLADKLEGTLSVERRSVDSAGKFGRSEFDVARSKFVGTFFDAALASRMAAVEVGHHRAKAP